MRRPGARSLVPERPGALASRDGALDRSLLPHARPDLKHGDESAGNAIPGLTLPLFAAMIDRIATWKILEGVLFHFDKRRPIPLPGRSRYGAWRGSAGWLPRWRSWPAAAGSWAPTWTLSRRSCARAADPGFSERSFSLADVSWLVIFERLVQADCLQCFVGEGRRPECASYWARLRHRPSYRQAILDQSHATIDYGTKRLQAAKAADPALRAALEGS